MPAAVTRRRVASVPCTWYRSVSHRYLHPHPRLCPFAAPAHRTPHAYISSSSRAGDEPNAQFGCCMRSVMNTLARVLHLPSRFYWRGGASRPNELRDGHTEGVLQTTQRVVSVAGAHNNLFLANAPATRAGHGRTMVAPTLSSSLSHDVNSEVTNGLEMSKSIHGHRRNTFVDGTRAEHVPFSHARTQRDCSGAIQHPLLTSCRTDVYARSPRPNPIHQHRTEADETRSAALCRASQDGKTCTTNAGGGGVYYRSCIEGYALLCHAARARALRGAGQRTHDMQRILRHIMHQNNNDSDNDSGVKNNSSRSSSSSNILSNMMYSCINTSRTRYSSCALDTQEEEWDGCLDGSAGAAERQRARGRVVMYSTDQVDPTLIAVARLIGFEHVRILPTVYTSHRRHQSTHLPELCRCIAEDVAHGRLPCMLVGVFGSALSGSVEALTEWAKLAARVGLWMHLDARYGGSALLSVATVHSHCASSSNNKSKSYLCGNANDSSNYGTGFDPSVDPCGVRCNDPSNAGLCTTSDARAEVTRVTLAPSSTQLTFMETKPEGNHPSTNYANTHGAHNINTTDKTIVGSDYSNTAKNGKSCNGHNKDASIKSTEYPLGNDTDDIGATQRWCDSVREFYNACNLADSVLVGLSTPHLPFSLPGGCMGGDGEARDDTAVALYTTQLSSLARAREALYDGQFGRDGGGRTCVHPRRREWQQRHFGETNTTTDAADVSTAKYAFSSSSSLHVSDGSMARTPILTEPWYGGISARVGDLDSNRANCDSSSNTATPTTKRSATGTTTPRVHNTVGAREDDDTLFYNKVNEKSDNRMASGSNIIIDSRRVCIDDTCPIDSGALWAYRMAVSRHQALLRCLASRLRADGRFELPFDSTPCGFVLLRWLARSDEATVTLAQCWADVVAEYSGVLKHNASSLDDGNDDDRDNSAAKKGLGNDAAAAPVITQNWSNSFRLELHHIQRRVWIGVSFAHAPLGLLPLRPRRCDGDTTVSSGATDRVVVRWVMSTLTEAVAKVQPADTEHASS